MKWSFFPNLGGQESGFHDAGVETFKGNLERYLAREVIQNSLDARDDPRKPVLVRFQRLRLAASSIPDFKTLAATFERCANYWKGVQKTREFFERSQKLARAKTVTALRIGDFNTKGVTGTDTDRADCWYSLIRCSGSSSKSTGEGGSFGIGKNAPFAASHMRTVLYSTMTKNRDLAFQGVAKLVTHVHPKGGNAQHIGYLGGERGSSVRNKKEIPPDLVRVKPGTDLTILGYIEEGDWKKDLVFSVLENFWPAIHFGDLEAEVEDITISKSNLSKLLTEYSTEPEFTAFDFYRAFTEKEGKTFEEKLPTLKKVEVHLLAGDQNLPKKVAMVRKTGMVIYQQAFRSLVPYCGVFLCRNDAGNMLLREMEPPKHDEWDQNHPEKNAHKKTALEFTAYIRDCVRKLAPSDSETVLNIPDLSQYLPDDEDSPDESFRGEIEQGSKKESFDRKPEQQTIKARSMDRSRRQMQPDETRPGQGDADTEENGVGIGSGGGPGNGGANNENGGRGGGGGGGTGEGSAGPRLGSGDGHSSKPAIPLRSRVFAKDLSAGIYSVIAEPIKPVHGAIILTLKAIGDDASASAVAIQSARLVGGAALAKPAKPGTLGPLTLDGKNRLHIEVTLVEPRKLAMEVEAHEAE